MKRWHRAGRVLAILLAAVVIGMGTLYLLRHPILRAVGGLLTHTDPIEPSEIIVVLSGDEDTRPFHAADLYTAGVAPLVVILQEELTPTVRLGLARSDTEIVVDVLLGRGVPRSAIRLLGEEHPVTSTRDEAAVIRDFVAERGITSMTVVTSPFHTARARYTLRRTMRDLPVGIRMAAAPQWLYDPDRWWENELGITHYGMEILKWVHTLGVLN